MSGLDARALGERVASARQRADLTQADLAATVGLDRSVLAKIEVGARRVSALELARIADAVDERIEWFVDDAPPSVVSHRDTREPGTPSPGIDRLVERLTRNVEFLLRHDDRFVLPAVTAWTRPGSTGEMERAAAELRRAVGLDDAEPLINAASAGGAVGLLSFSVDLGADGADAASVLLPRGAVVLVNGYLRSGRRRLALVHDWGHCLFADEYSVDWRVAEDERKDAWEGRLDLFARAVLLPPHGVRAVWHDAREAGDDLRTTVVRLGSRYRVDMSTIARRLWELGYIDRGSAGFVRAVRTTKADIIELDLLNHDELAPPELPRDYQEAVVRLVRQEVVSPARATDLLLDTWDEADFPELPALPESATWQFVS